MGPSTLRKVFTVAALVLIWGAGWPVYKITLAFTPPVLFAGMRTLLGGLLLVALALPTWQRIRFHAHARTYLLGALFNTVLFYGGQTVGLTYLPEGIFSIVVYLEPVLVGVVAWIWLGESMNGKKLAGLLAGLAGVAAVSSGSLGGTLHLSTVGLILAFITGASWAVGTVVVKGAKEAPDLIWLSAIQSVLGGVVLTAGGLLTESWSAITWNGTYITGLLFGGILGIAAAWILFFTLLKWDEASQAAAYTFLVPLLAVAAGVLFLKEPLTVGLLIGLGLIALGIALVSRNTRPSPKAALPPVEPGG